MRGLAFFGQGPAVSSCGQSQLFKLGVYFAWRTVTNGRVRAFAIAPAGERGDHAKDANGRVGEGLIEPVVVDEQPCRPSLVAVQHTMDLFTKGDVGIGGCGAAEAAARQNRDPAGVDGHVRHRAVLEGMHPTGPITANRAIDRAARRSGRTRMTSPSSTTSSAAGDAGLENTTPTSSFTLARLHAPEQARALGLPPATPFSRAASSTQSTRRTVRPPRI